MPSKSRIAVRTVEKRSTRSQAPAPKKKLATFVPRLHSDEDSRAVHYMFKYKMGEGRRRLSVHGGFYNYGSTKCQHMFNRQGRCPNGRKCRFAHTSLEILFHPLVYKTRQCDKENCDQGEACAWAHSMEDYRYLSGDWLRADPVSLSEKRVIQQKKSKKKATRVRLAKPIVAAGAQRERVETPSWSATTSSSSPGMSVSVSPSNSPPRYDKSPPMVEVMVPASPAHVPVVVAAPLIEEADVSTEAVAEMKEMAVESKREEEADFAAAVVVQEKSAMKEGGGETEFERWYRSMFNCELLEWMHYLRQFEAKDLDDIGLLWDLYMDSRKKKSSEFSDLLVNEMSMVNEGARNLFVQRLCEYRSPVDIQGWLERVVGLPEYAELFASSLGRDARVDDLAHQGVDSDDLAEMGVSLVGHRMKILHHLRKFGEFDLMA